MRLVRLSSSCPISADARRSPWSQRLATRPRRESSTLVADQVYELLAKRIFDGELAAGDRLPVRDLADQVGTDVMPVREAIRVLVKNGLAVTHPHRGARVREFTVHELLDL